MKTENETIAVIAAEKRRCADKLEFIEEQSGRRDLFIRGLIDSLRNEADRIEAAGKRERELSKPYPESGGDLGQLGDAAALREALVCLRDAARNFCHHIFNSKYSVIMDKYTCCKQGFPAVLDLRYAIPKANFAISKPPRNCDVGSLAEQRQRFHVYCEKMQHTDKACCGGCPIVKLRLDGTIGNSCELAWAQMPHEQEGGAE